jgi:hypothetical protein
LVVASATSTPTGRTLSYIPTRTGRYYVLVVGNNPDVEADYTLWANVEDVRTRLILPGTLSTDGEGDGATATDPIETTVTSPRAGDVSIHEAEGSPPRSGFDLLGHIAMISAPAATPSAPLAIEFRIDASALPAGIDPATIEVLRDGVPASPCASTAEIAQPDPCVNKRTVQADGDLVIRVLTSHASEWTFGPRAQVLPPPPTTTTPSTPTASIREVATTSTVAATTVATLTAPPAVAGTTTATGVSSTDALPRQGDDSATQALIGFVLVTVGTTLLWLSSRRPSPRGEPGRQHPRWW